MATEYIKRRNPFLYGFSPWPFEDEDLTTTEAGIPVGAAGAANLAYGEDSDPFIAPLTYEGRTIEDPVETYAGGVTPKSLVTSPVSAGVTTDLYSDLGNVAPFADADTTIEPLIGLSDPTSVQYRDLMNRINQSRTTIPMNLAGANLTGNVIPSNLGTDLEAEPSLMDPNYPFFLGTDLEDEIPLFVEEDEDELKKSGLKKFFAQFKKGVGTFAERTREALKKTRDAIAPNFGLNREELTGTGPGGGYTDSQVDFMMMNALGKQAVDEGLFVSGFDYKNTSSGVQDKWNYNVYASNYQEPGSASYERWKNIKDSKAYKTEQAKKVAVTQAVTQAVSTGDGTTGDGTTGGEGGIGQWQGPGTQGVAGDVQQSGLGRQEEPGGGSFGGNQGDGYQGTGSEAAQDNYGGGWDDGYWAKGGLIRKKYGDGGIVDLL